MTTQDKITLLPAAEQSLKDIGFDDMELFRIKTNPEVVRQVNQFFTEPHEQPAIYLDPHRNGAAFDPNKNTIIFPNDSRYLTYDILVHELGHALGKRQPKEPNFYQTPEEYAKAVSIGEAEAILNEYRILQIDKKYVVQAGAEFYKLELLEYLDKNFFKGRNIEQLSSKEQENVYNYLANENAKMIPSSFGGYKNSLTYQEKSIINYFMHMGQLDNYLTMMEKPTQDIELLMQDNQIFHETKAMLSNKLYNQTSQSSEQINASKIQQDVVVFGGKDLETIIGSAYDDKLIGGAGLDTLIGGKGNDKLHGGV